MRGITSGYEPLLNSSPLLHLNKNDLKLKTEEKEKLFFVGLIHIGFPALFSLCLILEIMFLPFLWWLNVF